jgi:hypothetical protein
MIKDWDETLEASIKEFQGKKEAGEGSWELISLNPTIDVSLKEEKAEEKVANQPKSKKKKKAATKKKGNK